MDGVIYMEIGARLKEARETKGISLDSLQETTKIQKRYLEAIEEGNFHILPGKFYARAFIKEYAVVVGIDSNELLEEYKEEVPKSEDENTAQYTRINRSRKDKSSTKSPAVFSLIPTIIVIILVIGIIFAAWYFIQQNETDNSSEPVEEQKDNEIFYPDENGQGTAKSGDSSAETDSGSTDEKNKENTDSKNNDNQETGEPQPEFTVVEKGSGTSPESTLAIENTGNKVMVTVEPTGASWLEISNGDGETIFSGMLTTEDSTKEFDMSEAERIYFNVGSAPNLTITINGVKLDYPLNPEVKVHQYLWINIQSEQSNE